jgi:uncharacterized protein YjiS (DUF1127 family)
MTQITSRPALAYLDAAATLPALSVLAVRAAVVMAIWSERLRTRNDLKSLNTAGLRDIGLTPGQALHEARKPFWRK